MIVGDSGRGIAQTLKASYYQGPGQLASNLTKGNKRALAHNIVRWAFDRWSTEKDTTARERGVRGLFRVDRLVAKYFGQIAVRTGQTMFVREHLVNAPPIERFNNAPQRFAHVSGTVIRIRMTGVTVVGMADLLTRHRPEVRDRSATKLIGHAPPQVMFVSALTKDGFDSATEEKLTQLIGHPTARPTTVHLFLVGVGVGTRSIERALRFLCLHASPLPICALNVRCSLDELDSIASSINAECDGIDYATDSSASQSEQLDPVLAIHESGAIRWVGLPTPIAELLHKTGPGQATSIPADRYASILKIKGRLQTFFTIEGGGDAPPF